MKSFPGAVSALLWTSSVVVAAVAAERLDCTLSSPIPFGPDGNLLLRQRMNLVDQTATFQFIYKGQAWLGLGRSNTGGMIGGEAVIGIPGEDDSPAKYSMFTEDEDGSGVVLMDSQTLMDSSITQNETHTVLTYTKLLEEEGELSIPAEGSATYIWAVGRNNDYPSVHALDGVFKIELYPCSVIQEEEPEENDEQQAEPENEQETPDSTGDNEGKEEGDDESTTTTESTTTATSDSNNNNKGAEQGQDPQPNFGFVEMESQESTNRQKWVAHGVLMALSWGVFVPIAIGASLLRNCSIIRPCWFMLHRALNVLAVLCTAIGFFVAVAAIQEEGEPHFSENKHTKAGLAVFLLVVLQAIFAFLKPGLPNSKVQKEMDDDGVSDHNEKGDDSAGMIEDDVDDDGEQEEDNDVELHKRPRDSVIEVKSFEGSEDDDAIEIKSESNRGSVSQQEKNQTMEAGSTSDEDSDDYGPQSPENEEAEEEQGNDDDDDTREENNVGEGKSLARRLWEYSHRAVGVAVTGLAWYSCQSGLDEYALKYNDDEGADVATTIFWAITGTIAGIVFFLAYVVRM